jgi:heme exporter protein A
MIEVRGLAKYFGRFSALRDLHLTVPQGQSVALFGRNGAGKTTFLRILAGLSRPSGGAATVHAARPGSLDARRVTGYLSHNTALYLDLTALENLRFYARLLDLSCRDADLESRIARVGLAGRGREPVRHYSRGMQQRLAIARAFLHDPEVLLLDEPFTGLDQAGTGFLKSYLNEARQRGKTCLMAIHDEPLGYDLCDRLVVIEKGVAALDLPRPSTSLEEFQNQYRKLTEED